MNDENDVSRETMAALADLPPAPARAISALADWTASHAAPIGLTNFHTPEQVLTHGIAPAISLANLQDLPPAATWAELGPGSGVLGLTLALLLPDAQVTLVDRRQRVIDYLELTIARAGIANATALLLDPDRASGAPRWDEVLFRALARPDIALSMAARLAIHGIYAFHSPTVLAYHTPPAGFARADTRPTPAPNLAVTWYHRLTA